MKGKDNNKKIPQSPKMNNVHYWTPSIEIGTMLLLLKLLSVYLAHRRNLAEVFQDESEDTCPNSQNYSDLAAEFTFFTILFCNIVFGRREDTEGHYNPRSDRIIQGIARALPIVLAVTYSIFTFVSQTFAGSRAERINEIAGDINIGAIMTSRIAATENRLINHGMDRSPSLDGDMTVIDYAAWQVERWIIHLLELGAHGGFLAMDTGVTRFRVTEQNAAYVLSSIYAATDAIEIPLVSLSNELFYYLIRITNLPGIFHLLRTVGADPSRQIHALDPPKEKLEKVIDKIESAAKSGFERLKNLFHWNSGHHESAVTERHDDDNRKPTPEEKDEMDREEADQGAGSSSTIVSEDHTEDRLRTDAVAVAADHHVIMDIVGNVAHALHLGHVEPTGPAVTLTLQSNGSYHADFSAVGNKRIHINKLPDDTTICFDPLSTDSSVIIKLPGGQCFKCSKVQAAHHAGGAFKSWKEDHKKIGEIDGRQAHSYHLAPNHVLVRVDECDEYEMNLHGKDYFGSVMHPDGSI